jgi:U4/U6.U5 tri-snRNP-associated protein 2
MMPLYTYEIVARLDKEPLYGRALDGTEYYPGCLGLNNLKNTDYVNVIIQALCRVKPLRDFCLFYQLKDHSIANPKQELVMRFAELVKKIWNPKNFKGHVSPHEVLQAMSNASNKRFRVGEQKDPIQLLTWFFNTANEHMNEALQ